MKKIANIILLSPILLYLLLILINKELLDIKENISLFWIWEINLPIISVTTIFFVLYIIIIWLLLKFSEIFTSIKKNRLEREIKDLKATMQDWQWDLLWSIKKDFVEILEGFKEENKKSIETLKKENEKVVTNLNYEINNLKERINEK